MYLFNPRSVKQKVAVATISGLGGVDKFHFLEIPKHWYKVDVKDALFPKCPLMYEKPDADQLFLKDVVKGNTIWDQQHIGYST